MQGNEVISLRASPTVLGSLYEFILHACSGKSVLNVGASGGVEHYLPGHEEKWLHYQLTLVAKEVIGIDIDRDSIRYAARYGFELLEGDCEVLDLGRRFDVIVMSDVIEHLNAPGKAIQALMQHLNKKGKLIITTPNPTHYALILRSFLGKDLRVYYDHVACFLPENFQAICDRFGYHLDKVAFFSHLDRRSGMMMVKSLASKAIGRLFKRLNSAFVVVIRSSAKGS